MKYAKRIIAMLLALTLAALSIMSCGKAEKTEETPDINSVSDLEQEAISLLRTHGSTEGKEETVYILADADGVVQKTIVSAWLKNPEEAETIRDVSDLTDIKNADGEETFTQDGSTLVWNAAGNDIRYRGTSSDALPLTTTITYLLDGNKVTAEELSGATGHITITFDYQNNTGSERTVNGETATLYQPFLVISGLALNNENVQNVQVTNGKVLNTGSSSFVIGTAMPGLADSLGLKELTDTDGNALGIDIPESVTIEMDATNFSLMTTVTVYDNSALTALSLDSVTSVEDLSDAITKLTDASTALLDGSSDLFDGTKELKDGTADLNSGASELQDGVTAYLDGASEINDGVQEISDSMPGLVSGISELKDGSAAVVNGSALLVNGMENEEAGILSGAKQLKDGTQALNDTLTSADSLITLTEEQKALISENASTGTAAYAGQFASSVTSSLADGVDGKKAAIRAAGEEGAASQSTAFAQGILNGTSAAIAASKETAQTSGSAAASAYASAFASGAASGISASVAAGRETIAAASASQVTADDSLTALIAAGLAAQNGSTDVTPYLETAQTYLLTYGQTVASVTAGSVVDSVAAGITSEGSVAAVASGMTDSLSSLGSGIAGTVVDTIAASVNSDAGVASTAEGLKESLKTLGGTIAESTADGISASLRSDETQAVVSQGLEAPLGALGSGTALSTADSLVGTINQRIPEMMSPYTSSIADGMSDLYDGLVSLDSGIASLSSGLSALDSGVGTLQTGAAALSTGMETLSTGTETLVSNNGTITDGFTALTGGISELDSGAGTLMDGAEALKDGMAEFDAEGIQKLSDALSGKLQTVLDRLDALKEYSKEYTSFSGAAEGMDSSVRFVMRTESIGE